MNSDVMPSRIQMEKEELKQLTQEVKETLDLVQSDEKTFGSADLWNVQRKMKSASRYFRKWELS